MTDETRELVRFGAALVVTVPLVVAWCRLVNWCVFKLFDRWFR